jgi:hypothetical protein
MEGEDGRKMKLRNLTENFFEERIAISQSHPSLLAYPKSSCLQWVRLRLRLWHGLTLQLISQIGALLSIPLLVSFPSPSCPL